MIDHCLLVLTKPGIAYQVGHDTFVVSQSSMVWTKSISWVELELSPASIDNAESVKRDIVLILSSSGRPAWSFDGLLCRVQRILSPVSV